jgi:methionyl-tRNA formyltransferase
VNDTPKIIFAGSGEFGVPTLGRLIESGISIVQVFSQPDRPAGRGRQLHPTAIAQLALERGLPLVRTDNINAQTLPPADLLLVIAFGQKVAPHVVDHARLGSINLHASRLPKFRGAAPVNWAIIRGETRTGNSIIRLAQRMDAGNILAQSDLEIGELETAGELHDRLAEDGANLVPRVMASMIEGTATETTQDDSQATLAPKLTRDKSRIDWVQPANEIASRIRGMYPWPGCRVRVIDPRGAEVARATLVRARALQLVHSVPPGQITTSGCIATAGDSAVQIVEILPEGKRPMPLEAYRNGHRWEAGMHLESIT